MEPEKYGGREALLSALFCARDLGIRRWIQGGLSPEEWHFQWDVKRIVAESAPELEIIPCIGLHPWWVADPARTETEIDRALQILQARLNQARREGEEVWLGELGLDAMDKWGGSSGIQWERQLRVFEAQLALASTGAGATPMALHLVGRAAHDEALKRVHPRNTTRGIVHRFSADAQTGIEWVKRGYALSIGPEVTRPGYKALKSAIRGTDPQFGSYLLPDSAFVFESDAPWVLPSGEVLGPAMVREVEKKFVITRKG